MKTKDYSSNLLGDVDITQLMLPMQGREQSQTLPVGLQQEYVAFDERSEDELFEFLKKLSHLLKFYEDNSQTPIGNWEHFFEFGGTSASDYFINNEGRVSPHLALFKVFIEQYQQGPLENLKALKQDYVDFYYRDVLRLKKYTAKPANAHLIVELKKNSRPIILEQVHQFIAGKTDDGKLQYAHPTSSQIVNHAKVESLRSSFRTASNSPQIHVASIANSKDGLGEAFDKGEQSWSAFGNSTLPVVESGFALSSEYLLLSEGLRTITTEVILTQSLSTSTKSLAGVFDAILTTEKGWTDRVTASASLKGNKLTISVELDADFPAITPYFSDVHGFALDAQMPVMNITLNKQASNDTLNTLVNAFVQSIVLRVDVEDMHQLEVISDIGPVSADTSFLPFGATPKYGSKMHIGSAEIFSKRLSSMTLNIAWKNPPASIKSRYTGYDSVIDLSAVNNDYFKAAADLKDGVGRKLSKESVQLFNSIDARKLVSITLTEDGKDEDNSPKGNQMMQMLAGHQSAWAQKAFHQVSMITPQYQSSGFGLSGKQFKALSLDTQQNRLSISLKASFFHDKYREAYTKYVVDLPNATDNNTPEFVNEPYTPEIESLSVNYNAYTQSVSFTNGSLSSFANDELRFFHLDVFGQRREHAFQRQQLSYVTEKRVSLLPQANQTAALYIGLSGVNAGDSCQLLFQVVEGSADPLLPPATLKWSILCDNYFKGLDHESLISDDTNGLQTSGIVKLVFPAETTKVNTLLPSGYVWLKVSTDDSINAVCQLVDVVANAIKVVALTQEDIPVLESLPAETISKLQPNLTDIKSITQPYASFDGAPEESQDDYASRVSARLRHKDRAMSVWDIENLILHEFRHVHKVKVVPHAKPGNWHAPGHALIVLVPSIDPKNAINPLQPRVSTNTLANVKSFVQKRSPMLSTIHTSNPDYLQIKLTFKVKFTLGSEFNFYRDELEQLLQEYLSPWIAGESKNDLDNDGLAYDIKFGGVLYKSVILDFIEAQPFVDFATDVVLQFSVNGDQFSDDRTSVKVGKPNQVLTSYTSHSITEFVDEDTSNAGVTNV